MVVGEFVEGGHFGSQRFKRSAKMTRFRYSRKRAHFPVADKFRRKDAFSVTLSPNVTLSTNVTLSLSKGDIQVRAGMPARNFRCPSHAGDRRRQGDNSFRFVDRPEKRHLRQTALEILLPARFMPVFVRSRKYDHIRPFHAGLLFPERPAGKQVIVSERPLRIEQKHVHVPLQLPVLEGVVQNDYVRAQFFDCVHAGSEPVGTCQDCCPR